MGRWMAVVFVVASALVGCGGGECYCLGALVTIETARGVCAQVEGPCQICEAECNDAGRDHLYLVCRGACSMPCSRPGSCNARDP